MLRQLYSTEGLFEASLVESDGSVVFSNVTGGGVHRHRDGDTGGVIERRRGIGGLAAHADGGFVMTGREVVRSTRVGVRGRPIPAARVPLPQPGGLWRKYCARTGDAANATVEQVSIGPRDFGSSGTGGRMWVMPWSER
ncbi:MULTISPECIES: hypothetical protein [Nocardia]|uniref:hypothetical protein n=1 Tax=Nocardia TaxID=1817 RepID=UPI000D6924C3|nr:MULTISPECIES: hypothetical protein [Nocardia]